MEGLDSKIEKNLSISSMSERQAILYLEKASSNINNNSKSEPRNILLDYHQYYLFKKKHHEQEMPKEKLEQRRKLFNLSLKEYNPIKKSIYMDRKKNTNFADDDDYQCNCRPNKFTQSEVDEILRTHYKDKTEDELFGCGKCINKIIFTECDENCRCGISCRNRRFQKHEYAEVYPIKTEDRGWGLCAGTFLPKDTFIMQYIGEIYSLDSEYGEKKLKEYQDKTCTYLMGLPNNNRHEVIDPTKNGNMARFINHSCDPNCETRKWHVKGELCIGIFAKKDIKEDEELTFNYDFDLNKTRYQKCLCGSKNCRGYLGISTEENKKTLDRNLNCSLCKEVCKHNESIVDCKTCGKFFHKKCAKKKGQLSSNNEYKCSHCVKKYLNPSDILSRKDDILKEKIKLDEEPIYDEIYEVGDEDLQKIKKNLGELINIGAGLFWDFQGENAILGTSNTIDLKISGTTKQIEGVKEAIRKLKLKKEEGTNEYNVKLNVPKIYIRKIIGHQFRNLDSYKSKFGVQIIYDTSLITDEIFSIQESTTIEIKGKESNVKAVVLNIKKYLYNLKVISIYLLQQDYNYLRQNICNLKTNVDPADLRLRKSDIKNEREIKHPFYYISNNIKDIVIIGFDNEIEKAKNIIKNSILRQNNIAFNYSLTFLFPIYFKNKLSDFELANEDEIKSNKIIIESKEPEFLRRHISVTISGRWVDIANIKAKLWKYLKNYVIEGVPKKHDINEFEQYAYNQEHKLISKSIRTYIIEQSPQIKNWDYISEDVEYLQQKYFDQKLIGQSSPDRKKDGLDVIENFIYTSDKETRVNYLLNMRPGSYKKVFNMSQNDLFSDILGVLEETYSAYKNSKLIQDNISSNENKSEEYYGNKEKNRGKNSNDAFVEPQKITSSIFYCTEEKSREENINHQKNELHLSNDNYNGFNSNNNSNFKKYQDNQNIISNNQISSLSNDKVQNYLEVPKDTLSIAKDSYLSNNYYKNSNISNQYSQYKNTNNDNLSNTKSFISQSQNNISNMDSFKSNQKQYNIRQNYSNSNYNLNNNYSRKDNDASSNSSFLNRKTNRVGSRSSSEARKDNNSFYHKKENRNYSDYEERRYYKHYNKYEKDYDRYDRKERKNSPYKDYYYDDSSYNNNNRLNDYSMKYSDRDRNRDFDKDRDRRDNDRERNSWQRSNSQSPKNKYQINYKNNNLGNQNSNIGNRYNGNNTNNNDYINDNNKIYNNYNSNNKDSYKDYRVYTQINKDRDNYSSRNFNNNDNKNMNYNDNRYSSKYNYDNGYYRKRFFNDNKYSDKRKSGYKGISSNYISGNKYTDRQERSRSRSRNSRSRSRSWGRRSSHSRYRNRDMIKRGHSNSNSVHKFNDNYE
jgi:hypothetical protein